MISDDSIKNTVRHNHSYFIRFFFGLPVTNAVTYRVITISVIAVK